MLLPLILAQVPTSEPSLLGFSKAAAAEQRSIEARFDRGIAAGDLRTWMQRLSARPHHVGSLYGLENARFMQSLYQSFGFDAKIETFGVLFAEPKERVLEMGRFRARLREPEVKGDDASNHAKEALPVYNCYSCDGDVRGQLVYVNYGVPADYETLAQNGIDVKGKIVIARYGGSWRGIKPKVAAEHGAIGCIIYSDPRDDGYGQGDAYPDGGWRSRDSAQRGSVADMPVFPGDPLTPGIGATPDAKRIPMSEATTLTKIPVLPIAYGDAEPLIRDLTGRVVPAAWRGGLPTPYHFGPSRQEVHLKLKFNWKTVECRDVIATLRGSEKPDEWVIRGNHHDAWVTGADDPISGQVAMLAEAKSIGALARSGWRPKRTLVYCSWDGEEPGLLGSTEWCETHADELSQKAVAYINSDSNGRGFVGVDGSHALEPFVNEVTRDVTDPETKLSVLGRVRARSLAGGDAAAKGRAKAKSDEPLGALGSGSDFSPFLQHLGIASINVGYGGEGEGTQYHSTYDSFAWYTRFADVDFAYGVTLAQTAGRMALRLANEETSPFDFARLAKTVDGYAKELDKLVTTMRTETEEQNRLLADGTISATHDPRVPLVAPKPKDPVPTVNLKPLMDAVERLNQAVKSNPTDFRRAFAAERALLGPGLPGRPWYRHTLYAPGLYTGYGVKTLPGVREALEERRWSEAEAQAVIAAAALDRLSAALKG